MLFVEVLNFIEVEKYSVIAVYRVAVGNDFFYIGNRGGGSVELMQF